MMRWLCLAEALAAVAGIVTWKKWKHTYIKWFVFYLIIIAITEIIVRVLMHQKKIEEVVFINQLLVLFEISFIHWYFYKTLACNKFKLIIAGIAIYLSAWVLEKYYLSSAQYYFQSLSYTLGNLFILIYLVLFFIEFVQSDKIMAFTKQVTFWIATGFLVFYLGTFPFFGLYNELAKDMSLFLPLATVATCLNYGMYILFSIGLLWGKAH